MRRQPVKIGFQSVAGKYWDATSPEILFQIMNHLVGGLLRAIAHLYDRDQFGLQISCRPYQVSCLACFTSAHTAKGTQCRVAHPAEHGPGPIQSRGVGVVFVHDPRCAITMSAACSRIFRRLLRGWIYLRPMPATSKSTKLPVMMSSSSTTPYSAVPRTSVCSTGRKNPEYFHPCRDRHTLSGHGSVRQ